MVYQYLGEEERDIAKMKRIAPYRPEQPIPRAPSPEEGALASANPTEATAYVPEAVPSTALAVNPPAAVLPPTSPNQPSTDTGLNVIPSSEYIGAAPSTSRRVVAANPAVTAVAPAPRGRAALSREDRTAPVDMPTPPGFVRSSSRHFTVFAEQYPASERFIELIESLHSNLMLDLAPFTPWANNERTTAQHKRELLVAICLQYDQSRHQQIFSYGLARRADRLRRKTASQPLPARPDGHLGTFADFQRVSHRTSEGVSGELHHYSSVTRYGLRTQFQRTAIGCGGLAQRKLLSTNPMPLLLDTEAASIYAVGLCASRRRHSRLEHNQQCKHVSHPAPVVHRITQ